MNKNIFRILALSGLMLLGILVSLLNATGNNNADSIACVPNSGEFFKPHFKQVDSTTYEAFFIAKMWSFEPKEIYIPVNSDLDIFVSSDDVVHSFDIENKNVQIQVMPGTVMKKTVHFDKPGIYKIACHEYCGEPHKFMKSEIIVSDKIK
jgi:cytochrome c oxidase subunit 2